MQRLPHRVGVLLPSSNIMATFICNGKTYKVKFFGQRKIKMFGSGWRQFVEEHNLFEGDRLKFKVKERSDQKLELNVNILKCNVSGRLHAERRGTVERPINVWLWWWVRSMFYLFFLFTPILLFWTLNLWSTIIRLLLLAFGIFSIGIINIFCKRYMQ